MYALNFRVCFSLHLLFLSIHWVEVHVYCGHCFSKRLLKESVCEENESQQEAAIDQVFFLKEVGMKRERGEGSGWGERQGSAIDQDVLSLSPGYSQVWNMALFFWSWKQCTCWRPEDMSCPHVSFPLSQRYPRPVPLWIRVLVLTLHKWLSLDIFCNTTKVKKLFVVSFCLLTGFNCFWVVFPVKHQNAAKARAEYALLAPKQKKPWICCTRSVYLSCDSAEVGLWIWISSESRALAAVARPRPWQPCWINSFQMEGLKNEEEFWIKATTDLMDHYDRGPFLPIMSRETILFLNPCDSYCSQLKHNGVGGHRKKPDPGQLVIALEFDWHSTFFFHIRHGKMV